MVLVAKVIGLMQNLHCLFNRQATAIHNDPEPPELNYWSALTFPILSHCSKRKLQCISEVLVYSYLISMVFIDLTKGSKNKINNYN